MKAGVAKAERGIDREGEGGSLGPCGGKVKIGRESCIGDGVGASVHAVQPSLHCFPLKGPIVPYYVTPLLHFRVPHTEHHVILLIHPTPNSRFNTISLPCSIHAHLHSPHISLLPSPLWMDH